MVRALPCKRRSVKRRLSRVKVFVRQLADRLLRSRPCPTPPASGDASYRPARALQPFLTQARAFASDAEPTVRDLRVTVRKPGRGNDLIDFVNSIPPLADIAVDPAQRNGKSRRGAFPESVQAFKGGIPVKDASSAGR